MPITWNDTDLPIERIETVLGKSLVAHLLSGDRAEAIGYCAGRAAGYWDANEPEYYAAYTSLKNHLTSR